MQMKILAALIVFAGCFLFYYGSVMLFFVPGYPGERYLSVGRIGFGVLPFLGGIGLFALALWIFNRRRRDAGR